MFIVCISYIFAECDMMAMIAKNGYYLSGNSTTYDLFDFIRVRSHNVQSNKRNDDGYGFIYYPDVGTFNISNQSWYQTDPTPNDDTYYTGGLPIWQVELDDAEDYIINTVNDATIVLGHARQGSSGEGNHPFYFDYTYPGTQETKTFTLMHNGTLTNNLKTPMYTYLYNLGLLSTSNWYGVASDIDTWIDSEILFRYLMHFIDENNGNVISGIQEALTQEFLPGLPGGPNIPNSNIKNWIENPEYYYSYEISAYTYKRIANIVLSDSENLYIFRNSPSEGLSTPLHDPYHNLSYEEDNNLYVVKTLDDLDTRIDQFDFVVISKDESPIEYPNFLDSDAKTFSPGVTWVSFPRLTQQYTYNGESYEQAYWNTTLQTPGLLQSTLNGDPTINDFEIIEGYRDDEEIDIELSVLGFQDNGFNNMLFRHEGYKITVDEEGESTTLVVDGERLSDTYTISEALPAYTENWLGYWLPESRNIVAAFGEFWEYVEEVWAEDWYYNKCSNNRGIGDAEPVSWSTANKTLEYGKGYIVQFERTPQITGFHWTPSAETEEPSEKAESENFAYTEKPDYEVIDVVDIPENIAEIGVFQDEVCVGAVVVENECEQILVYSENANREEIPFTFEIVTGNRGMNQPVLNYLVFNENSGEFEKGIVISGRQVSSIIKFNEIGEPGNESLVVESIQLYGNYPNPFNPTTQISFSLPDEEEIELTIYNVKGQKVKTLFSGFAEEGIHSLTWNGENDAGRSVSSGIYFYKLKTNSKELIRKMLMMK